MKTRIFLFVALLSYVCIYGENVSNDNINSDALVCSTTINSFPYHESFENGWGAWTEKISSNIWRIYSGSTPSTNTGPTGAYDGNYYAYTEASYPNNPNKPAVLEGPCFDLNGTSYANFQFQYHMWGNDVGSLKLEVSTNAGSSWTSLWSKSGNQDNAWYRAGIDLNAYVGQIIQLRFYGQTGAGWTGDIAIDDLYLSTAPNISPPPCNTTISNYPYQESFEIGTGGWVEQVSSNIWRRFSGGTSSSGTGPSAASDGNYYFYTESSSPNYPNKTAILESPCFDLSNENAAFYNFDYHMYGSAMGTLNLEISTDGALNWSKLWSATGNQGNIWYSANIDLSAYTGQIIQLRFHGITGTSYTSDMAIDKLQLTSTPPPGSTGCTNLISTFPYQEGFESNWGVWTETTSSLDIWRRQSGSTPSSSTGPSSAYDGNYYVYAETSGPNYPNKIGLLEGACFDLNQAAIADIQFHYHMYGATMGSLELQLSTNNGVGWNTIWSRTGDQGNAWHPSTVDLSSYVGGIIRLRFKAITGSSFTGDMAIDAIILSAPTSATGTLAGSVQFPFTNGCANSNYQECCEPNPTGGDVANIEIEIQDLDNSTSDTALTDGNGIFTKNITGSTVALNVNFSDNSWTNGVTSFDAAILNQHIAGTKIIDCPLRRLAADVDNDGDLDSNDVALIQDLVLGNISFFPNAGNWKFIPKAYAAANDLHPDKRFVADFWNKATQDANGMDYPFKGVIRSAGNLYSYGGTNSWMGQLHATTFDPNQFCSGNNWGFYMVKSGDINGSASYYFQGPGGGSSSKRATSSTLLPSSPVGINGNAEKDLKKYEASIVLTTETKVQVYQMNIEFDDEIIELGKIKPNEDFLEEVESENFGRAIRTDRGGSFKTMWMADAEKDPEGLDMSEEVTLFSFEFRSKESLEVVRCAIRLDNALLESAFYGSDGLIEDVDLQLFVELED